MAAGRMVNLGQVGFGLVADTDELKASLDVLKTFGREVDRLSKLTSESNVQAHAWGVSMEGTLTRMQTAAQSAVRQLQALGASQEAVNEVQQNSSKVIKELVDHWDELEGQKNRVMRATVGQTEMINRVMQQERAAAQARKQYESDNEQAILMDTKRTEQEYALKSKYVQQYETLRRTEARQTQQILNQNAVMTNQVGTLATKAQVVGVAGDSVTNMQGSLGTFLNTQDIAARQNALRNLRGEMAAVQQEVIRAQGTANTFSTALRDLERATILAMGPLSGVGARLAVLSALFESTSFGTAAIIGGIVGIGAAATLLSVDTIKATMEMQRFTAILTASTGSAALAADEYLKVQQISEKWGFSVREMVEPYAKFTAAARLSGLAIEEQSNAFEAVSIAARATNLNTERTSLIFLALEQMLSKGVVYMEEMRRQLGDLLPGAFQIAAQAMGMTQAQFTKAITEGRILAVDLIPKLSDALMSIFGPAAQVAAHNLQAEFGRFSTAAFEVWNSIEKTTHITEAFTSVVVMATGALQYMAANMRDIIGWIGAMAGSAGVIALIAGWSALASVWAYSRTVLIGLRDAILAVDFVAMTSATGQLGIRLLQLALVVGGGVASFYALRPAAEDATKSVDDFINKAEMWIDIQQKVGETSRQSAEEMEKATIKNLKNINAELDAAKIALQAKQTIQQKTDDLLFGANAEAMRRRQASGQRAVDPETQAMDAKVKDLEQKSARINAILDDIMGTKRTSPDNDPTASSAFENWIKKVEKDIRQVQTLTDEASAFAQGGDAVKKFKSIGEAMNLLAEMPEKGQSQSDLEQLVLRLKDLGYTFQGQVPIADALRQQLIQLFEAINKGKDDVRNLTQQLNDQKEANKTIANTWEDLLAKRLALTGANTDATKSEEAIARQVENLRQAYGKLFAGTGDVAEIQDYVNGKLREFEGILRDNKGIEDYNKHIETLKKQMEALDNVIGSRLDRSMERQSDQVSKAIELQQAGLANAEQTQARLDAINADAYRVALSRATIFGRELQGMFKEVENTLAKSMADSAMGVQDAWKNMFTNLERYILEFVFKVGVISPMMKALFGGAFTQQKEDMGTGVFEGLIGKISGLNFKKAFLSGQDPEVEAQQAEQAQAMLQDSAYTDMDPFANLPNDFQNFADGGSFKVGGTGGTDSQRVAFNASPDETVAITRPGQSSGGMMPSVTININNESGVPLGATSGTPRLEGGQMVMDLLLSHLSRNADSRENLSRTLSEPKH